MNFLVAYKMAIKSILSNKIRSILTMLGVIIGVAAVIASIGFAEGSMATITNMIEDMGSNMISVMILDTSESRQLTTKDLNNLVNSSKYISSISPYIMSSARVKAPGNSWDTRVLGISPSFQEMSGIKVIRGRFISEDDNNQNAKVAVIGDRGNSELFNGKDPLGQTIRVNGTQFTIIGILESVANGAAGTNDDRMFIPVNVAERTLKISTVTMFMASANSAENVDIATVKIQDFLYDIYHDDDSYAVITQESVLSILNDVTAILMIVMGSIAAISLIVGGIGIMNIMLVSVTERTKEIGIRKAIGAKKKDIMIQFLIEALMITCIGGVIGIILGICIIKFIIGGSGLIEAVYSLPWTIGAFSIAVVIGVLFGIFPANKAANLHPIEALRNE